MIFLIIGLVALFIAATAIIICLICEDIGNEKLCNTCYTIARVFTAFWAICVLLSFFMYKNINIQQRLNTKEYPASEYELKYKIVDYDGKYDTTYVLIPIKLKEQQEKMRNKY